MWPRSKSWIFSLLAFLLLACGSGYQKENGAWVWVSYDESAGKRVTYLDPHDSESFEVLSSNKSYAKDHNSVFFEGRLMKDADPGTFEVLPQEGYSKDNKRVYLTKFQVVFADPHTFQVLEFPYSRDANKIFCGTLPMDLSKNELGEFKVTNEDKLMAGMRSTMALSHFIELNPEYSWLDTLGITGIVVGEWATAETSKRKFKGLKEVSGEAYPKIK